MAAKSPSTQYRRRARELEEMAERARTSERRRQLLKMARQYEKWADEIEKPKPAR